MISTATASSWRLRRRRWRRVTCSPGRALSTNTVLPPTRATPRPSWDSDSISAVMIGAVPTPGSRRRPGVEEFCEVRLVLTAQIVAQPPALRGMGRAGEPAAHQFEAQENKIGVEHIGLAVLADLRKPALSIGLPHPAAVHAQLAGKTQQARDLVERGGAARLIAGQHVHQIGVAPVKAAQISVVTEGGIVVARLPVARRGDAVQQRAVVQHRQVETATVPGHQRRRIALNALEEAPDDV